MTGVLVLSFIGLAGVIRLISLGPSKRNGMM
jgi:hypothetical protein